MTTRIATVIQDEVQRGLDRTTKGWRPSVSLKVRKVTSRPGEFEVAVVAPAKAPKWLVLMALSKVEGELEEKNGGLRLLILPEFPASSRSLKKGKKSVRGSGSRLGK